MSSTSLITLLLLGAVFYLFLIAPQRRRMRQQQQMANSLVPGSEIMTTTGLYATVHGFDGDEVLLEVAPGVVSRYAKGAIARVITSPDQPDPEEPEEPQEPRGDDTESSGGTSTS